MRKVIHAEKAPKTTGLPLSQAILHDSKYSLEISGQIGIDPSIGKLTEGIRSQTEQTILNIESILQSVGWTLENVVKTRIFLADMSHYKEMNEVYAEKFSHDPPARFALAVKELPLHALVEIECTAAGDELTLSKS